MSEGRQTVIGRITTLTDGRTVVVPLDERRQVLAHQKRLNALITAARAYAADPSTSTAEILLRAARLLDS